MKEKDKILILKLLLKATFVLLFVSIFLKILGLNVFGVDTSNAILVNISNFLEKYYLRNVIDWILLFIQYFIFFKLCCKSGDKKIIFASILATIITSLIQLYIFGINNFLSVGISNTIYTLSTIIILIFFPLIIDIDFIYSNKKETWKKNLLNNLIIIIKKIIYIKECLFFNYIKIVLVILIIKYLKHCLT